MLELDVKNKISLQMSCDAFYWLYCGDEPLDPDNLEEAEEIAAMFPHGFLIDDNYEFVVDDPGLIEAIFIPYRPDTFQADAYDKLTTEARLEIKYLSGDKLIYRLYNTKYGEYSGIWSRAEVPIETNKFGLRFFKTRGGSMFFLRNFLKA